MQLRDFVQRFNRRAGEWPFAELIAAIRNDPDFPEAFVREALTDGIGKGTYFDLTLSHIPEAAFGRLVELALDLLEQEGPEGNAEAVVAYTSLQHPEALHPHLPRIFQLRPNESTYCAVWPWRGSWPGSRGHLLEILQSAASPDLRRKAWSCLCECRTTESLSLALEYAPSVDLRQPLEFQLHQVGLDADSRQLYRDDCRHLIFAPDYIHDERPIWNDRTLHPTWRLPATGTDLRFGGTLPGACGLCAGSLHHLVTLPEPRASLATCLSCIGWEQQPLFYRHDAAGLPIPLDRGSVRPRVPSEPLVETTVRLATTPTRWQWQDWGLSNSRENLFRLGGHPTWIQGPEYPRCPDCARTMEFLLQLDSDLPLQDGAPLYWGSGGIGYVFWCGACRISAVSEQHT